MRDHNNMTTNENKVDTSNVSNEAEVATPVVETKVETAKVEAPVTTTNELTNAEMVKMITDLQKEVSKNAHFTGKRLDGLHNMTKTEVIAKDSKTATAEAELKAEKERNAFLTSSLKKTTAKAIDAQLTKKLVNNNADEMTAELFAEKLINKGVANYDVETESVLMSHGDKQVDVDSWLKNFEITDEGKRLFKVKSNKGVTTKVDGSKPITDKVSTSSHVDSKVLDKFLSKNGEFASRAYNNLLSQMPQDSITSDKLSAEIKKLSIK